MRACYHGGRVQARRALKTIQTPRRLAWALFVTACPVDPPLADNTSPSTSSPSSPSSSSSSSPSSSSSDTTTTPTSTDPSSTASTSSTIDTPPPAPTLVSPADGATDIPLETSLCWDLVADPEGEPVRYRVFVDDTELTNGIKGEDGHAGPCVGPLDFMTERTYAWRVLAFEVDDPTHTSPDSATWTFSTIPEPGSQTVFADNFNDGDLGWEIGGDALAGAWVRGKPSRTLDGQALSQPGNCFGGTGCFFTGHNPDEIADQADVSGGTTTLTSPAFDLGGAAAATVQLARFFYKSDPGPGPRLTVELLVPDPNDPDQTIAHSLEQLAEPTAGTTDNLWLPREYPLCGLPLTDGARLRISATDEGAGILEAAIDSVVVRAHSEATICGIGEGGACDPGVPMACPADLLCCAQGVLNEGIHRCTPPVAGLDFEDPPPTQDSPGNGPPGCDAPDLILDTKFLLPIFTQISVTNETCEYYEGCVGGLGGRTVMLFTTATPNIGSRDLVMGIPANHPELYHYSACHDHYHFDEFARYQLLAGDLLAATGHKQAFCMLDTISWAWPNEFPKFDCTNQGISRGFSDWYESGLPCQWIDITGVPPGDYTLFITLNQPRPDHALPVLVERDYTNNSTAVIVSIP